jgi:hypothetical protein
LLEEGENREENQNKKRRMGNEDWGIRRMKEINGEEYEEQKVDNGGVIWEKKEKMEWRIKIKTEKWRKAWREELRAKRENEKEN